MAIYLTTGTPGAGKTLWTLWTVEQRRITDNKDFYQKWVDAGSDPENLPLVRDVYYFNINIKKLPWIRLAKPEDWLDAPKGSLFVFDECQEAFPPRANSSTPPKYVSELAKARHGGYDLYFVTQHPTFVDPYIRKLAEEHNHLMRPWGAKKAVVHTWKGVKDQCDKSRAGSLTSSFSHPKEVYGWYKSAEVHTHKFKLPFKVKLMLLLPLLIAACVYGVISYFGKKIDGAKLPVPVDANGQPFTTGATQKEAFDPASFVARISDIPWSSPRYDDLTKPTVAPRIVGCMIYKSECKCLTQQGTYHIATMQFCKVVVENGIFQDFDDSGGRGSSQDSKQQTKAEPDSTKSKPVPATEKVAQIDPGFNLPVRSPVERLQASNSQPSGNIYPNAIGSSQVMFGGK